jgi:asparagine synthase (glutamine-hydrolysing)
MASAIRHRGPDDSGFWCDDQAGVALGQRRLAIIDLSPAGHQPMPSASGRFVVVFNGEIYNFRELRAELEAAGMAPSWRGHSDTEVLLAAIEAWGDVGALERLNGMFALALWDRQTRTLLLARDRLGEKPLYFGRHGDTFLFGSELKALQAHPAFRADLDRNALTSFFRYSYVPTPHSIWHGVQKLRAGHYIKVTDQGCTLGPMTSYWDFAQIARMGRADLEADEPNRVDELDRLLREAVRSRMVADVPLGAFLSGGIDSSTVVALMQAQSTRPVRTFTIGFEEAEYDEMAHAEGVARHLGTDHTSLVLTPSDALDVVPKLPEMFDEPFADSSQIPTYLVSHMTRQHVTVALSGDGGDELFGGYNRYFLAQRFLKARSLVPSAMHAPLAYLLRSAAAGRMAELAMAAVPERYRFRAVGDRLPKIADVLLSDRPELLYRKLVSHSDQPSDIVLGGTELPSIHGAGLPFADFRDAMMYLDTLTYLPDDILTKVDRASMAVSLETRVPMLDHRVVEFAWRLPASSKFSGGQGKRILRDVLYRYVPQSLMERPKMGFGVPIDTWLTGPLRDWAESLLDPSRLKSEGVLDPRPIRTMWEEHVSGRRRWHYHLWDVLMFQAWWEKQRSHKSLTVEAVPPIASAA